MNFHLPSSLHNRPFADALQVFGYCISHPAESNDSAMHTDAWVWEAFVAWESLNHSWLMEELGFILDQVWADMQMYLWFAVDDLDQSQVRHSIWEFNFLVVEAFKSNVVIAPLVLDMLSPMVQPSPLLLLTPHCVGPWRMPTDDHSLPTASPDIRSPVTGPSQPMHVISAVEDDAEDLEPACKRLHHGPSPPHIPRGEKGKGRTVSAHKSLFYFPLLLKHAYWFVLAFQKLRTECPQKLPEDTVHKPIKRSGFGEPIPCNVLEIPHRDLRPIGLVVPNKDFGDFVGCKGAFFKRSVAHKVGHFMSISCDSCKHASVQCRSVLTGSTKCFHCTIHKHECLFNNEIAASILEPVFVPKTPLVTEIRGLLPQLRHEACQMNNTEDNIPSLFRASHLDTIELVSSLFEKGVVEGLVDLEAEEAEEDEDLDAKAGPDDECYDFSTYLILSSAYHYLIISQVLTHSYHDYNGQTQQWYYGS
ncbi:hypothetical protein F5146DRAFT_1129232 [Armillaria mellea]|nr:hypothetical protein F5146DRAFT_1129232 [Armillaria mellea]